MAYKALSPILYGVPAEEEWPERYTPFRCPSLGLRNTDTTGSVSPQYLQEPDLPPFSSFPIQPNCPKYYDYLKSVYDSKSSCSLGLPDYQESFHSVHNTPMPPHTALASRGSPSFHSPQYAGYRNISVWWSDHNLPIPPTRQKPIQSEDNEKQSDEKLVWVDLLNQWILEEKLPKPYLTFVKNPPTEDRLFARRQALTPKKSHCEKCQRFEVHMANMVEKMNIPRSELRHFLYMYYTLRGFKKTSKDRRAPERKVHSTPPYTSTSSSSMNKKVQFQTSQSEAASPIASLSLEHQCSLSHLEWDEEVEEMMPEKELSLPQINVLQVEEEKELVSQVLVEEPSFVQSTITSLSGITVDEESSDEVERLDGSSIRVKVSKKDKRIQLPLLSSSLSLLPSESSSEEKIHGKKNEKEKGKEKGKGKEKEKLRSGPNSKRKKRPKKVKSPRCRGKSGRRRKSLAASKRILEQLAALQEKEEQDRIDAIREEEEAALTEAQISNQGIAEEVKKNRRTIVKKGRVQRRRVVETKVTEDTPPVTPPVHIVEAKKVVSWIFGDDDFSCKEEPEKKIVEVDLHLTPPEIVQTLETKLDQKKQENRRKSVNTVNSLITNQKRRKPPPISQTYNDELERFQKAEERRKKQQDALERHRAKKSNMQEEEEEDLGIPRFEDNGFLAKYCIFNRSNMEMYKRAFDAVDENKKGWLTGTDAMIALKGVNSKLTETAEVYLYRVLELIGFKVTDGADFKLFSVLSALSVKLSLLEEWMKNIIDQMDFKALDMKMFACKKLWECNVDKSTNKISLDQLCIELRAGGISLKHELEVREKLGHLRALDLLDFLTYIPLFIMIHMSVVNNPLSDSRDK